MDNRETEHSYPRVTDPASDAELAVTGGAQNNYNTPKTFVVNVGESYSGGYFAPLEMELIASILRIVLVNMVKYLSGRVKRTPQDQLKEDRYQYLNLEQAEPNLSDPLIGPNSSTRWSISIDRYTRYQSKILGSCRWRIDTRCNYYI